MPNSYYYPFEKEGRLNHKKESYDDLTAFEKYQLSFHPERPKYLDYLSLFQSPQECFASGEHGACLIQTHRAGFDAGEKTVPVMLIGQQTGPTSTYKELVEALRDPAAVHTWNHGMPTAASYWRAIAAIRAANEERRLIICFVDTPGADPTEESEADGIAWRIGDTIRGLIEAAVPTIAVIMNRACSGGAIALTGCDVVLAMEYSTYLVISPEAASSILFRTRARANEAAQASRITSKDGFEFGIVDELVPESNGPAHRNPQEAFHNLRDALVRRMKELLPMNPDELFEYRMKRWGAIGHWSTIAEETVKATQRFVSRLPARSEDGFVKRHGDCFYENGKRRYDPEYFDTLRKNNYVCESCGYRYVRPSVWDYMSLILDDGSFVEHTTTRLIADKDILGFPEYHAKIEQARRETGLVTAMLTGNGKILNTEVVFCAADFGFLGGSFCMSTGEKIWRAASVAVEQRLPTVLIASGGGARMQEGCSSMVSIPKVHLAMTRVEHAGLPVVTIITDPTLGGVAIGYASRGVQLFELNAGNIGFSGKRVIEQYTGKPTSKDFQTTSWLKRYGHAKQIASPANIREVIGKVIGGAK